MRHTGLRRRLAAEFTGSGLLLGAVVGSGIMAERLADGNVALALIGNTLATGAILVVLILMFARVSGAHFNPAVSLVFRLRGELTTGHALQYAAAQLLGALAGVGLAHLMFDMDVLQLSLRERSGFALCLSEGVATFGLALAILGTLPYGEKTVAAAVGLYITAAYWFTASTSFANPAVTVGRALTDTFSGLRPVDVPAFVLSQFIGAALAVWLARWIFSRNE